MSNRNLSTMFPNASGTKTYAGAAARLAKVQTFLDSNNVVHCVVQRPDGTFIAVAVLHDRNSWCVSAFTSANICVTN